MRPLSQFFAGILFLSGCTSVQPELWQPLPQTIELIEQITFSATLGRQITLPKGTYRYWYSNDLGYFFANQESELTMVQKAAFTAEKNTRFKGGLCLSRRAKSVSAYRLSTESEEAKKMGEVAHLAARTAGDRDGLYRALEGVLPKEVVAKLELKP
jgi:hypothetical protein